MSQLRLRAFRLLSGVEVHSDDHTLRVFVSDVFAVTTFPAVDSVGVAWRCNGVNEIAP